MKEELHQELAKLQGELDKLGTAIDHIDNAKKLSESIVENGQQLQKKYEEQLEEAKEIIQHYEGLAEASDKLVEKISEVHFPARFDELGRKISDVNKGISEVDSKFGKTSNNLKEEVLTNRKLVQAKLNSLKAGQEKAFKILYSLAGIIIILQIISFFLLR